MKTFTIAIAAATALVGVVVSANAEEHHINGTLSGAAIGAGAGAVVAGPPGLVVGAVVGAVVGGPKIVYYHGHRSYTDERQRRYYWDNHRRHYYVVRD